MAKLQGKIKWEFTHGRVGFGKRVRRPVGRLAAKTESGESLDEATP
jgi:hypothetical protein